MTIRCCNDHLWKSVQAIRINEFLRAQEDKWHHRFGEFADEQRQALQAEIEREKSRLRREMERENKYVSIIRVLVCPMMFIVLLT